MSAFILVQIFLLVSLHWCISDLCGIWHIRWRNFTAAIFSRLSLYINMMGSWFKLKKNKKKKRTKLLRPGRWEGGRGGRWRDYSFTGQCIFSNLWIKSEDEPGVSSYSKACWIITWKERVTRQGTKANWSESVSGVCSPQWVFNFFFLTIYRF